MLSALLVLASLPLLWYSIRTLIYGVKVERGELTVVGQDSIRINLQHKKHPRHISVRFADRPHHIPCDHHGKDELEWFCSQGEPHQAHFQINDDDACDDDDGNRDYTHHHPNEPEHFYLTIFWKVADVRLIVWEARW